MSLHFPFEAPPARGQSIEVAPGVRWVRMPLPMKLDHINVWGIEDGEGWAIVDTGMRSEDTVNAWREVFAQAQEPGPITRVFVTHMHPDHIGMAGWLTRKFGCRLWMTRLEYLSCRVVVSDTGREAPPEGVEFCRRAGWGDAAIEA
ncbi:MAG TPA: MBL fold metallo-hydrolase, partial [Burkholderiaceae bacterium]|nr:MBL fold metallo-hydrolase [Burkholderiaceae bacterium]